MKSRTLPHLDLRLKTVAKQIQADCHADIGSDHGNLLVALLKTGRIKKGIAVENKQQPYENSRRALIGLDGQARLADGLDGVGIGEIDSLSVCGMGGRSIVAILQAYPDRIPTKVVLQPNRDADQVRRWAIEFGYHLVEEQVVWGQLPYPVLNYHAASGRDPSYHDMNCEAAVLFGPINIRRREPLFVEKLIEERRYLHSLSGLNLKSRHRLKMINYVLGEWLDHPEC